MAGQFDITGLSSAHRRRYWSAPSTICDKVEASRTASTASVMSSSTPASTRSSLDRSRRSSPRSPGHDVRADERYGRSRGCCANAQRFADREAVVDGEASVDLRGALRRAGGEARRAVMAAGIGAGDRVVIWAPNSLEFVVAALGLLGAGAWLVPIDTRVKGDEAVYVMRKSGAPVLFTVGGFLGIDYVELLTHTDPRLAASCRMVMLSGDPRRDAETFPAFLAGGAAVDEAPRRPDRGHRLDVSDIMFTSGTTGAIPRASAAPRRQHALLPRLLQRGLSAPPWRPDPGDTTVLPLLRVQGRVDAGAYDRRHHGPHGRVRSGDGAADHRAGAGERGHRSTDTVDVAPRPSRAGTYRPVVAAHRVRRSRIRTRGTPPTHARRAPRGAHLHRVSPAPRRPPAMCSITRPGDSPDTISTWNGGTPVDDIEIRIVDDDGDRVAVGHARRDLVRGYNVMSRLLRRPRRDGGGDRRPTAGSTPATSRCATTTATSRSPTARRTCYIVGGFNASPAESKALLRGPVRRQPGRGDRRPRPPAGRGRRPSSSHRAGASTVDPTRHRVR